MIRYVTGDATAPQGDGPKVIAHVCNDAGGWGAGFVLALSRRWNAPEAGYRRWWEATLTRRTDYPLRLGNTLYVAVEPPIVVANMVAQEGFGQDGRPPLRYAHLHACLADVALYCLNDRVVNGHLDSHPDVREGARYSWVRPSVHMPRIGCGLAGGSWDEVSSIIESALCARGIEVTVYDLPGSR